MESRAAALHGPAANRQWRNQLFDLRRAIGEIDGKSPLLSAIESYARWADEEFRAVHDHFRLLGEDNYRRYSPVEPLRIRIHAEDSLFEVFARATAARAAGGRATISAPPQLAGPASEAIALLDQLTDSWGAAIEFIEEDDMRLAELITAGRVARVRYANARRVPGAVRAAAASALQFVADASVLGHGRIELLWYVREQSIAHVYHRYGNLGLRAGESRAEPE
jgi:RHH-type proline utilization regulon transcriptional repressor/proline dehydrogenase/delta 1-pyrroline-5-carboxylate dehydrogenase